MSIDRVPRRFRGIEQRYVEGHRVSLLRDGREAFPAMLADIEAARRQILLEMYWFDSDATGRKFARALMDAARRGVEVAVIYDSLGSWEADRAMFDEMRGRGVRVIEFNPLNPWRRSVRLERLSIRDHRKILVVDGEIGFTGGINLANHWAPEEEGGAGWRDDMVRIHGPAVFGFVECFLRTWDAEDGPRLRAVPEPAVAPQGPQRVRVLGEAFLKHRREILRAYVSNIYRAGKRIWITNSYFVPSAVITRALIRAARRNVDVRVLLPGKSDVEVVRLASRAMYGKLMDAGVRIFEWTANVLHAKTAVIDSRWSTIGTLNLDYRSLRGNLEVNASVLDAGFGAVLEASFLRDLEHSVEIDPHRFAMRSIAERALGAVLYPFRSLL
jgi:cardiolipin synthase